MLRRFALADAGKCGRDADRQGPRTYELAARRAAARQGDRYRGHRGARATGAYSAAGGPGGCGRRDVLATAVAGHAVPRIVLSSDVVEQCASEIDRCAAGDFRAGAGCTLLNNVGGK